MKTFTYIKITSSHGDEEYGYDFDYTVESKDLLDAVVDIVYRQYFLDCLWVAIKDNIRRFISDTDILDALVEYYEDELKDHFRAEAFEEEANG